MGRKMKSLESQLEKQQQDLSEGQRGSVRARASACRIQGSLRPNQGALRQEHL